KGGHGLFDCRCAYHTCAAHLDENRSFSLPNEAWSDPDRSQLIRRSSFCSHRKNAVFSSRGITFVIERSISSGSKSRQCPASVSFSTPPIRILTCLISGRL